MKRRVMPGSDPSVSIELANNNKFCVAMNWRKGSCWNDDGFKCAASIAATVIILHLSSKRWLTYALYSNNSTAH
jgi:hypothetical protein